MRKRKVNIISPVEGYFLMNTIRAFNDDIIFNGERDYVCEICGEKEGFDNICLHLDYFICMKCAQKNKKDIRTIELEQAGD